MTTFFGNIALLAKSKVIIPKSFQMLSIVELRSGWLIKDLWNSPIKMAY